MRREGAGSERGRPAVRDLVERLVAERGLQALVHAGAGRARQALALARLDEALLRRAAVFDGGPGGAEQQGEGQKGKAGGGEADHGRSPWGCVRGGRTLRPKARRAR